MGGQRAAAPVTCLAAWDAAPCAAGPSGFVLTASADLPTTQAPDPVSQAFHKSLQQTCKTNLAVHADPALPPLHASNTADDTSGHHVGPLVEPSQREGPGLLLLITASSHRAQELPAGA